MRSLSPTPSPPPTASALHATALRARTRRFARRWPKATQAQLHSRAGLSLPPDAGVPQAPLEPFTLGGGWCAVLRHQGTYATMRAACQWLYGQWLVQSGYEAADSPVFEEYLNNPRDTPPELLLSDIYLPLVDGVAPSP
jgi:DNA gyrase inhibitor GyrI